MITMIILYLSILSNVIKSMEEFNSILPSNQENQMSPIITNNNNHDGNSDLNSQANEIQEVSDQSIFQEYVTLTNVNGDANQQQENEEDDLISRSEENFIPISVSQTKQRYDWTPYFITNDQNEKLDQNLEYLLNKIEGNGPNVQLRPNFYPNFDFKPINWGADENHFENQEDYVNIFDKSDSENEDELPKFTSFKKASRKLSYGSASTIEFQDKEEFFDPNLIRTTKTIQNDHLEISDSENEDELPKFTFSKKASRKLSYGSFNDPNLIRTPETTKTDPIENSLKRNRLFLQHSNELDLENQRKEEIKEDYEDLEYSLEYLPHQVERLKKNLKYFSAATIKALKKEVDLLYRFERAPMKHTSDLEFRENHVRDIFDSIIEAQNMVQPFVIADIFSNKDNDSENKIFSLGQEQKQEMLKKLIFELLKKNTRKL